MHNLNIDTVMKMCGFVVLLFRKIGQDENLSTTMEKIKSIPELFVFF